MNFLHPGFLVAGLVVSTLPILIHLLLRRRRAPVEWAAMALLEEAIRRTSRRLRIEQLLLLALRVLAILLVGVALAVPFLGSANNASTSRRTIVLVLDDGVQSGLRVGETTELAQLAQDGISTLEGLQSGDRVALVLASKPCRIELLPTQDHTSVVRALERAVAAEAATDFVGAFSLVEQIREGVDGPLDVAVLSHFRRGSIPEGGMLPPLTQRDQAPISIQLHPAATTAGTNASVLSVEPRIDISGTSVLALVRLARVGENLASESTRVWLTGEGVSTGQPRLLRWEAGQSGATIELTAPIDQSKGMDGLAAIEAHISTDQLSADDTFTALYEARSTTRVGVAGHRTNLSGATIESLPSSVWVARALVPSELARDMQVTDLDAASLDSRALLGLHALLVTNPTLVTELGWRAIGSFVDQGGVVLLFPDSGFEAQTWTAQMSNTLRVPWSFSSETLPLTEPLRLDAQQPSQQRANALFRAIEGELPALLAPLEVYRYLHATSVADEDVSLRLENGSPFVLATRPDGATRGSVAMLTTSPELSWTNLPVKPAIVPLLQEALRSGLQAAGGVRSGIVGERALFIGESGGSIESRDGKRLMIGSDGWTSGVFPSTGVWRGGEKRSTAVAVHVDTNATRLGVVPRAEILRHFSPTGAASTVFTHEQGERATRFLSHPSTVAQGCLIALAIVLLSESILSKAFSRAGERRAGRAGSATDLGWRGPRSYARLRTQPNSAQHHSTPIASSSGITS